MKRQFLKPVKINFCSIDPDHFRTPGFSGFKVRQCQVGVIKIKGGYFMTDS
jgi:hypothetical protein